MKKHSYKLFLSTIKFAVLSLSILFGGYLAAQTNDRNYETIDITGEKSTPQLKRAFKKQQMEFIELYNTVNTDAQFDVICKWRKFTGSQIARKLCEPRYMIDFRALTVQTWSTQPGIDFNRLPNDDTLRFLTQDTREEAYKHVAALVATHPKLLDSFLKLDAIHERIKARKAAGMNGEQCGWFNTKNNCYGLKYKRLA